MAEKSNKRNLGARTAAGVATELTRGVRGVQRKVAERVTQAQVQAARDVSNARVAAARRLNFERRAADNALRQTRYAAEGAVSAARTSAAQAASAARATAAQTAARDLDAVRIARNAERAAARKLSTELNRGRDIVNGVRQVRGIRPTDVPGRILAAREQLRAARAAVADAPMRAAGAIPARNAAYANIRAGYQTAVNTATQTAEQAIVDAVAARAAQRTAALSTARDIVANAVSSSDEVVRMAGPRTGLERFAVRSGETVQKAADVARTVGSKASALNPIRVGGIRTAITPGTGLGRFANPLYYTNKAVQGTAKLFTGAAAKGAAILAPNAAGRVAGALARGAFGPASFAASSWIDAGFQAYDFFSGGDTLKGAGSAIAADVPGFAKTYAKEVGKGALRFVTLGFFGNGDNSEDIDNFNRALMKTYNAGIGASKSRERDPIDRQGFRDYMGKIQREHELREARFMEIRDNWDKYTEESSPFANVLSRSSSPEQYYKTAVANEAKRYATAVEKAMDSDVARGIVDKNRAAAYTLYTGRNYAVDSQSVAPTEELIKFNELWDSKDAAAKALWDRDAEVKAYNQALLAERERIAQGGGDYGSSN